MSKLSELLVAAQGGRGVRDIAAAAHERGHLLSPGTVSKYLNGRHGRPDEQTLAAFSDALGLDIQELRRAAGVPIGEPEPYVPPKEADRLSAAQRQALDGLIQAIVDGGEVGGGDAASMTKPSPEGGSGRSGSVTRLRRAPEVEHDEDGVEIAPAARRGKAAHEPDDVTGEESQDDGGDEPA